MSKRVLTKQDEENRWKLMLLQEVPVLIKAPGKMAILYENPTFS
jgi:hypothetical protein